MFHVKPEHADTLRRYQRALRQRNAALRQPGADENQVDTFTEPLLVAAEQLSANREAYIESLVPVLSDTLHHLMPGLALTTR